MNSPRDIQQIESLDYADFPKSKRFRLCGLRG